MKKLSIALTIFLTAALVNTSVAQQVITIQEAIENTLKNNLQVTKSKLNEELADVNLKQSKAALYPSVNADISQRMAWGRNNSGTSGIYENTQNYSFGPGANAGLDLFNGFSKVNQIKQNKILLEAGKASTDKLKNDLTLQVIISYLDILYNKDRLVAAKQQLTVAQGQLTQQQELLKVGNKTLADIAESRSLVATAELDVTTADNARTISYLALAQLMDIPSATNYEIQAPVLSAFNKPSTAYDPEEVYAEAVKVFPDLKLASLQTASAKKSIDIAKGSLYPRFSISGSYGTFYNYNYTTGFPNPAFNDQINNNISKSLSMGLSIPIFNGLQAKAGIKRASINLLQVQADEQLAKNNLNKVIYQAVADLKAAASTFESTTKTFNARSEAFSVIEQRYNVGLVNSLDYSTSQTNKNRAEIDNIRAKYDLLFKAKVIDYYLGRQIIF